MKSIRHKKNPPDRRSLLPSVSPLNNFDPKKASEALALGLKYLKTQWNWKGSEISRVLHISTTTINYWLKRTRIPVSTAELNPDIQAITHLLSIHRSLHAMFNDEKRQTEWLTTTHPKIRKAPLQMMSESLEGLIFIRQYLDYVRGRGA